jgi:hypothetical protein
MEQQNKPHVCRRLVFDEEEKDNDADTPSDTENQYINNLKEEMERELQTKIDKWNYDFKNDVPLEGQWKWQPVLPAEPRDDQMEVHLENDQGA